MNVSSISTASFTGSLTTLLLAFTSVLSDTVVASTIQLFEYISKLNEIFSPSAVLATFQVLNSHMCLVATEQLREQAESSTVQCWETH